MVGLICLAEDGLYLLAMFCRIATTLGISRANLSHSLLTNQDNRATIVPFGNKIVSQKNILLSTQFGEDGGYGKRALEPLIDMAVAGVLFGL